MKKHLLALLTVLALAFRSEAQVFPNSSWMAFDSTDQFSLYFRFDNDSLAFSSDNITYVPVSEFTEAGNILTLFNDVTGCGSSPGTYTFTTSGDTAWFSVISDTCATRMAYMTTHYFVRMLTGAGEQTVAGGVAVFPNPSPDGVFRITLFGMNMERALVYTMDGRLVREMTLSAGATVSLDLGDLPQGVYTLVMQDGNKRAVAKLVR